MKHFKIIAYGGYGSRLCENPHDPQSGLYKRLSVSYSALKLSSSNPVSLYLRYERLDFPLRNAQKPSTKPCLVVQ